ncbi:hypothetical protein HELRODRAFT_162791 [Helobdella robusta]|uniref:Uncharacterized protein n=1 Tax=Helobdella robusta TaxID=6412 RepID=T1ET58_HELRO|nr:hypothetical protein HELRODRAFT_162791 [Helobdella robusta]ESN99273.1 hypothetical protein HELRODRAFT_162791 [Helobdella robusta]
MFLLNRDANLPDLFTLPHLTSTCLPSSAVYLHDVNNTCLHPSDLLNQQNFRACIFHGNSMMVPSYYDNLIFIEVARAREQDLEIYEERLGHKQPDEQQRGTSLNASTCNVSPVYVNGTCVNVVKKVVYLVRYNSYGIELVHINVTLDDIDNQTTFPFSQNHVLLFRKENESLTSLVRSGNPGYDDDSLVILSAGSNDM